MWSFLCSVYWHMSLGFLITQIAGAAANRATERSGTQVLGETVDLTAIVGLFAKGDEWVYKCRFCPATIQEQCCCGASRVVTKKL